MQPRSRKAHRRYTRSESDGIDRTRRELTDSGLDSLIEFANHTGRPWRSLWSGIGEWQINGEPFTEAGADELQANLSAALARVTRGRLPFDGPLDVTVTYYSNGRDVVLQGPQDDLEGYLSWLLVEACRSGHAKRLKQCSQCGRFFVAERSRACYCSAKCQDAASNARRARERKRGRRRYHDTFRSTSPRP